MINPNFKNKAQENKKLSFDLDLHRAYSAVYVIFCVLLNCLSVRSNARKETSLQEVLSSVQSKVVEEKVNLFNVNRNKLLDGAIRALRRATFSEDGRISVKFADDLGQPEGAIDAGGPTREFLRIAVDQVTNSSIFGGVESEKYITKCKTGWFTNLNRNKHIQIVIND